MIKDQIKDIISKYDEIYERAMNDGNYEVAIKALESKYRFESEHDPNGICDNND